MPAPRATTVPSDPPSCPGLVEAFNEFENSRSEGFYAWCAVINSEHLSANDGQVTCALIRERRFCAHHS
jgi:hypothetical protein